VTEPRTIQVGVRPLTVEDVIALARGQARVALDPDPELAARVERSVAALHAALERGEPVYGVTTGFGHSCDVAVPDAQRSQLPLNLVRFHGAGVGEPFNAEASAAILVARLASLARGYSSVRPRVLQGLCDLLNHRLLPRIPSQGSVGASGDLTPLSYVAAVLTGEREVFVEGDVQPADQALAQAGLQPLHLEPKESLALMNGTSAMTGLACLAHGAALRLSRFAAALTAMACDVMRGSPAHFDARLMALKPHPGQLLSARWIRDDLQWHGPDDGRLRAERLQDRYSLRCAPQVIGVALDALDFGRRLIETELNSVNDNPIVDPDDGRVLYGGHFYGGHVAFAMDGLKTVVANLADLLDRQLLLLCDPATNAGLPANLVGAPATQSAAHFGFKAMQITSSALAAEALKLTMPASAFSRSTENHNQDKVSMGTIAARDCLQVLGWTETIGVIHLLALCQAADLRRLEGCHARTRALHAAVRASVEGHRADRRMDRDIAAILDAYRADALPIGALS
jgi:histidine ammonia-lyase